MEREVVFKERMDVCLNHPEKAEIFWLEQMLIKAGYPYHFNFWDELKAVFGGGADGDPEKDIDWNTYNFLIQIGEPVGNRLTEISVCFSSQGDGKLLEVLDMREAAGDQNPNVDDGKLVSGLSAEQAMEIIEEFFKTAK